MNLVMSSSLSADRFSLSAPKKNLSRLLWIRWLLLLGLSFGVIVANRIFDAGLPTVILATLLCLAIVVNIFTHWRLLKNWPITNVEFAIQILLDIAGISIIFYCSGGATNPFVSYYLVPLIISAITLPWVYTVVFAILSLGAYTLLLFFYMPIAVLEPSGEHAHHTDGFNPHIIGMWFTFVMSASLITFFIVRMSSALREQEGEITAQREDNLRDEQVLAVATLAAGTAHELGSPLTTMKILLNEIEHDNAGNSTLQNDLQTLKLQVELCSTTLKQLTAQADVTDLNRKDKKPIKLYFSSLLERWQIIRPDVKSTIEYSGDGAIQSHFHPTLDQSLINLLNNAADVSPEKIDIHVKWDNHEVIITIDDCGSGVPNDIRQQLGQPFVSTKGKGLGLGLFLSNATISRSGGTVQLFDREEGGTTTVIKLPLAPSN